ncbi:MULTISPECIES: glycosyltransferase [Campylobacter]|uniref:glycosyltransferase n=1 Tax=Campylobacter TaxID=194 RepID=UPI00146FF655|nr:MULTISPECIES: glycosyltransferase [Campylobacter]MBN7289257.1 glycosyltransferase [Campylobacter curvus]MDU6827438.1 glycosyltransferase [Campylobacter sp.]
MKKISIFIPSFERGGVENNVILYSSILVEAGYCVDVVYNRADAQNFSKLGNKVNKVKLGWSIKIPHMHPRINDLLNMLIGCFLYLFKYRTNILIISFQGNIMPIAFCKLLGIKIIVRIASHPSIVNNEKGVVAKLSNKLKNIFYKYATVVIANSEVAARQIAIDAKVAVRTVYNPAFSQDIIAKSREPLLDEKFFSLKGKKIISVGRLVDIKDFQMLIKAFFIIQKKIEASLIVVGDGDKRKELEVLTENLNIKDKVYFVGFKKNPHNYVANSDLFVLSSKNEGLPNSLIEAIAVGVPVVSTNCLSGPSEILLDGKGGDLVEVGNVKQMANAIITNLKNIEYATKKHRIAYSNLNRFSYRIVKDQILKIVEKYV